MTWKSYAAVSGAGLLATYLFSTPPALGPERPAAAPSTTTSPSAGRLVDIQNEAERLQARTPHAAAYHAPSRNPFRFATPPAPPPRERSVDVPAEPTVAPEPPPPLPIRLNGIETNTVDGVRQRRAILMTEQGALIVREGDAVGSEYRVVRIDADAVEIVASDGTTRRIYLR